MIETSVDSAANSVEKGTKSLARAAKYKVSFNASIFLLCVHMYTGFHLGGGGGGHLPPLARVSPPLGNYVSLIFVEEVNLNKELNSISSRSKSNSVPQSTLNGVKSQFCLPGAYCEIALAI